MAGADRVRIEGDQLIVEDGGAIVVGSNATLSLRDGSILEDLTTPIAITKRLVGGYAKAGATAGWVIGAADNLPYLATLPASQTGSTLVVPITGLRHNETIKGFEVLAQIESAGGAVTLDADLRVIANDAAEPTDASIGAITQVAVAVDTAVFVAKMGLTHVVSEQETYYVLLTATTAAATDIILLGLVVLATEL